MAQEATKHHRCAQLSPQQLVTARQADERTTLKLIPNTKKCLVPTFASFPLWKHHQVVTWWIFLSSVSHQTLLHRTYTVWTERNYKRKTYGRSTTDGTVSQLFSASSPSSSFGTRFPKIHIFTLEKYELEFVLKLLLPLAPSTYQVYPDLFTDCTIAALDHWAGDQGLRAHLYFHDDSKKPPGKYFLTKTMFQENPVLLQAFLQTIWKNDAEYTSSYVLNTEPSRLHQKIEVENGWDVVTGSRELSVCLSIS